MHKVYVHKKKGTNEIFYVGQCAYKKRAYDKTGISRSKFWFRVFNKHGRDVEIWGDNLTKEQADNLERYLINAIGRRDKGLGPLVNLTDGADGCTGHVWTDEEKKRQSEKHKGQVPWNKGKKCPELSSIRIADWKKLKEERNAKS